MACGGRATTQPDGPVPRSVWLLLAVFGLLLALHAVLFPVWRGPDEPVHADMVRVVEETWRWPEPDDRQVSTRVTDTFEAYDYAPALPGGPFAAEDAPPRASRPSFEELGPDRPSEIPQHMAQHPPLYYAAGAAVLWLAEAFGVTLAFDAEVLVLRLASAAMVVPLPLFAWKAARRLTGDRSAALAAAVVPLAVPMLAHVAASVNNDNLLLVLVAAMTPLVVRAAMGDLSRRTAVAIGALGAMALLTKGFALALPPWLAAAYLLAAVRGRRARRTAGAAPSAALALRRGALAMSVMLGAGLWWWIRNVVVHGALQPLPLLNRSTPAGFEPDLGWWVPFALHRFVTRFWIDPKVVPEGAPPVESVLAVLLIGLVVAAFVRRGTAARRADLVVASLPFAGIAAIVLYGALTIYLESGSPRGIQGRYTYPGLVALGLVAMTGLVSLLGRFRRWAPAMVFVMATGLQVYAGVLGLERWWGGPAVGVGGSVEALLAWSPVPSVAVVVGMALLVVAWVGAGIALTGAGRRRLTDPPRP